MTLPFYVSWSKQKNVATVDMERVDGVYYFNSKGERFQDLSSISYQSHFGFNPKEIRDEMKRALDLIPVASPKAIYPEKIKITEELLSYMGKKDGKIFYTTSGAESIENALKLARQLTQKKIILARSNSYHGASMGALTVTGDWRNPPHLLPRDWVVRIPEPTEDNALEKTREIILATGPENIAGFCLETITGGNGVIIPTEAWWNGIQKLCDEFKLMLIMDEVVCGFERTGKSFGYQHYPQVKPDLICLAKGITGGLFPFGAVWTSQKIADHFEENILCLGLTNYAHPIGVYALKGVLNIIANPSFVQNLSQTQKVFHDCLEKLKKCSQVSAIRYKGMLAAIETHGELQAQTFYQKGLSLVVQNKRLILAPPLITTPEQIQEAMHILEETLS